MQWSNGRSCGRSWGSCHSLFLAMQVRISRISTDANTKAIDESQRLQKARVHQDHSDDLQRQILFVADNAEMSEIFAEFPDGEFDRAKYLAVFDALTRTQQYRITLYMYAQQARFDNLLFQKEQGFVDEEYWLTTCVPYLKQFAPSWDAVRNQWSTNVHTGSRKGTGRNMTAPGVLIRYP